MKKLKLKSWLSSILRRTADPDLREDRVGPPALPVSLQRRSQGPAQESAPGRLDQAHRQPKERRQRRQAAQVVPESRLDGHFREASESALPAQRGVRALRRGAFIHIFDREISKGIRRVLIITYYTLLYIHILSFIITLFFSLSLFFLLYFY